MVAKHLRTKGLKKTNLPSGPGNDWSKKRRKKSLQPYGDLNQRIMSALATTSSQQSGQ